ncbi:protein NLRC5 isoform X1 [Arapaima gigas]
MDRLCSVLAGCPALSAVQLSGGGVTDDTLQVLCESLPKLRVSRHIMLSCSSLTTDSLAGLGRSLAACAAVTEVNARLEDPPEVCVLFSRGRKTPSETMETLPLLSKKLRLTHCDLHPTHVDTLCQTLSGCPQLTLLDLSNNKLGNNGLKKLLDVLPQLSTIQEINTSNNGVTMDGVLLLVETLRTCRNLRDVDVSHGGEQRIIMKFHISKRWQQAKNPVAPLMMENGLHLLKKFSLQQTSVTPGSMNDLCRRLAQCTGLIQLDFSGGSLDRSSMERLLKHLPQMIRLKLLNLSGNLLGDEGIRHFVKLLPGLHTSASVRIDNNNLTQMGALHLVAAMSVCDQLVALEVSLGQEDRSTVQFALSSDYDLCQSLSLREWQFGDDHLQKLAEILPRCSRLEKLHLSCNKLPIELRVLLKTLSKLNALQSLEMENNGISAQVIEELLGELQCRLTHLDVRVVEPWLKAEAAVNLISSCLNLNPNIQHIRVEETTLSVTLEMRGGDQGKWCTELSISGADPDNTAPLVSSVKSIGLVDCSLQERHLLFLQSLCHKCPQLLELDLSHNSSGTEGADFLSSVLPGFRSLQKLSLDHHVIDDHAAAVLEKTLPQLPHLRTISLSHCSGFTVVGACHLVTAVSHCRLLQNISLQALQLEKEAVAYLATGLHSMTSVKQLVLSRVAVVTGSSAPLVVLPVLESLGKLQGIEVIELDEMWMGDQGVLELVKHLPTWTGLRRISLCNNYIADSLGASLVDALSNCTALEEIILSRNRLGDMTGCCLGQTLPLLSCIRVLDLQMNCLTAAGGAALISAFKVCRSLTDIVLSENHLGRVGMENLCAALPHMPSLRKLHLVSVGTPELSHLATSLGSCTCVEDVSFAWNEIGDEVAESLAEILPLCPRLKRVDLEFNSISVRGAEALAAGLHSSSSVQVIRLWKNPIATDELQKLSEKENRLSFSSM